MSEIEWKDYYGSVVIDLRSNRQKVVDWVLRRKREPILFVPSELSLEDEIDP